MSSTSTTVPAPPARQLAGTAITLYSGDGIAKAYEGAKPLLARALPDIVQLHVFPGALAAAARVAQQLRQAQPGVRIWVGVGVDWYARRFFGGAAGFTRDRLVKNCIQAAKQARDLGAECFVWNAEEAWKRDPKRPNSHLNNEVAREIVTKAVEACPSMVFAHTAYDHPTYHSGYAWRGWVGPGTPVTLALPQVYAAPGGDQVMAHRGSLERREARALATWRTAVAKNWIEADLESPDPADDLDWRPYVQAHSVPCIDTVALAVRHELVCFWAAPTRVDAEGRRAILALCTLAQKGFRGPDAVRAFQRSVGLKDDGLCGPKTLAALGVE